MLVAFTVLFQGLNGFDVTVTGVAEKAFAHVRFRILR